MRSGGTCTLPVRVTRTESSSVIVSPGLSTKLDMGRSFGWATSGGGVTFGGTELVVTQALQPR